MEPTRTEDALRPWLHHEMNCDSTQGYGVENGQRMTPQLPCSCGLDAALAALSPSAGRDGLRERIEAVLDRLDAHGRNLATTRSERLIGTAQGIADTSKEVRAALSEVDHG